MLSTYFLKIDFPPFTGEGKQREAGWEVWA